MPSARTCNYIWVAVTQISHPEQGDSDDVQRYKTGRKIIAGALDPPCCLRERRGEFMDLRVPSETFDSLANGFAKTGRLLGPSCQFNLLDRVVLPGLVPCVEWQH